MDKITFSIGMFLIFGIIFVIGVWIFFAAAVVGFLACLYSTKDWFISKLLGGRHG